MSVPCGSRDAQQQAIGAQPPRELPQAQEELQRMWSRGGRARQRAATKRDGVAMGAMSWHDVRSEREQRHGSRPPRLRRRPEWACSACGKANYMTNSACRECHGVRLGNEFIWPADTAQHAQPPYQLPPQATMPPPGITSWPPLPPGTLPPGPPPAAAAEPPSKARPAASRGSSKEASRGSSKEKDSRQPWEAAFMGKQHAWDRSTAPWAGQQQVGPLSPAERAKQLSEQADALEKLGVAGEAVAQIRQEAEDAWEEHAQTKPRKAKLKEARRRLRDAERKLTTAAKQIQTALEDHTAAEAEIQAPNQELEDLKLSPEPSCKHDTVLTLMRAAQKMADWLEAHSFGPPGAAPPLQALAEQMKNARGANGELCAELGLDADSLASPLIKVKHEPVDVEASDAEDDMEEEAPTPAGEGESEEEKRETSPKKPRTGSPAPPHAQRGTCYRTAGTGSQAAGTGSQASSSTSLSLEQKEAAERIAVRHPLSGPRSSPY